MPLQAVQQLLDDPNDKSPAQQEAYDCYTKSRAKYAQ